MKTKINFKKMLSLIGLLAVAVPGSLSVVACKEGPIAWSDLEPTIEQKEVYEYLSYWTEFNFYPVDWEKSDQEILFNEYKRLAIKNLDLKDISFVSPPKRTIIETFNPVPPFKQIEEAQIEYEIKYLDFTPIKIQAKMWVSIWTEMKVLKIMNNSRDSAYDLGIDDDHRADNPLIHSKIIEKVKAELKKYWDWELRLKYFNENWMSPIFNTIISDDLNFTTVQYWYNGQFCETWIKINKG